MKTSLKIALALLGLMASLPLLRAAEEKAPAGEPPRAGRGERGGRGQRAGQGGMMNAETRLAAIDQAVGGLTATQKSGIKEIYTKAQEQMQGLRGGGDREGARGKLAEIAVTTRNQVRALLTDEQKKKFDEMPQMERGGGGGAGRGRKKDQ